jgi:phosphoribosylcarboxyaminoimidazole (NCAIR) mutase
VIYLLCTRQSVDILQHFCIHYDVDISVAAHRTTGQIHVASAGGVAHLPGMLTVTIGDGSDAFLEQMDKKIHP